MYNYILQEKHKSVFTAVSVRASFGHDSSPIVPKNIQCNGDELTLSNCTFIEYNPQECQQVAGVICEGVFYSNTISGIS